MWTSRSRQMTQYFGLVRKANKNATWCWQWAFSVTAKIPCSFAHMIFSQNVKVNYFWWYELFSIFGPVQSRDRQTETMHMSPLCNLHRWAKKLYYCHDMITNGDFLLPYVSWHLNEVFTQSTRVFEDLALAKVLILSIYNERSSADSCVSQRVKAKTETKELS